jgi:hypothetical protein
MSSVAEGLSIELLADYEIEPSSVDIDGPFV